MTNNPYAPPTMSETARGSDASVVQEYRRGPAWYIIFSAVAGAFASVPLLPINTAAGLLTLPIGCALGGLMFRVRSRNWPQDPRVRLRQVVHSAIAISFPPLGLYFLAGPNAQGVGIILLGALVGMFITFGIFASGTRRFSVANHDIDEDQRPERNRMQ